MKEMTIGELLCLTKVEILAIRDMLVRQLAALPQGSAEYRDALATLANIDVILARREFAVANFHGTVPAP